jgi:hypothetical protein
MVRPGSIFLCAAFALGLASVALPSCTMTEGERCNISLSHDECASDLACTVPTGCTYAVCCPKDGHSSTTSACNACTEPEGDDAGEDAADAADAETTDAGANDAAEGG